MTTPADFTESKPNGVLATDLDGTLIPLEGNDQNKLDLQLLGSAIRENGIEIVFVTGRHLESIQVAIKEFDLPTPGWIICDVGTSVFRLDREGKPVAVDAYRLRLQELLGQESVSHFQRYLHEVANLRLQEPEKQGQFKLSFYVDSSHLASTTTAVASALNENGISHGIIASVDPFNGDGLIDVLPPKVSKAFALDWLTSFQDFGYDSIVFAGDSGNDFAALTAGYKSIVVANAPADLVDRVKNCHVEIGWCDRLHLATQEATSGVLEGCRFFKLI